MEVAGDTVAVVGAVGVGLGDTVGIVGDYVGLLVGLRHGDGHGVGEDHLGGISDTAHIRGDGGTAACGDVLGHGGIAVLVQLTGLIADQEVIQLTLGVLGAAHGDAPLLHVLLQNGELGGVGIHEEHEGVSLVEELIQLVDLTLITLHEGGVAQAQEIGLGIVGDEETAVGGDLVLGEVESHHVEARAVNQLTEGLTAFHGLAVIGDEGGDGRLGAGQSQEQGSDLLLAVVGPLLARVILEEEVIVGADAVLGAELKDDLMGIDVGGGGRLVLLYLGGILLDVEVFHLDGIGELLLEGQDAVLHQAQLVDGVDLVPLGAELDVDGDGLLAVGNPLGIHLLHHGNGVVADDLQKLLGGGVHGHLGTGGVLGDGGVHLPHEAVG